MLRKYLDRIKPNFEEGGRLHSFHSVFDGIETFLYTPRTTSASGVHIHDSLDSKRIMIIVVLALMPCLLFGMYNTGYQNFLGSGAASFPLLPIMAYGFLAILPKIAVTYVVGLGIEFIAAQWRKEEIQEGFLVTGILVPLICPIETPLWMLAVATAFSVIFVKEVFGGTGYNIFNVALVTRAFLFFAYPASMSGDRAFISASPICGIGGTVNFADGISGATPLGQIATHSGGALQIHNIVGDPVSNWDAFFRTYPRFFRRDIHSVHPNRSSVAAYNRHCQLENNAFCFRGRSACRICSEYVRYSNLPVFLSYAMAATHLRRLSLLPPCSWLPTR